MTALVDTDDCALLHGRYQDVLDGLQVSCVIADPPYGERTHRGHDDNAADGTIDGGERSRPLSYSFWTEIEVREFVETWSPRASGWLAIQSCSDLAPIWRREFERAGRVAFAPVPCIMWGATVRQQGDGPSSWTVYLNVARPRSREFVGKKQPRGGTTPGAYVGGRREQGHIGGKPLWMMAAIVRDYTRPGDVVCDPCAGFGTTGRAALGLGLSFVGAEVDADTAAKAAEQLRRTDHAEAVREALAKQAAGNKKRGLDVPQP